MNPLNPLTWISRPTGWHFLVLGILLAVIGFLPSMRSNRSIDERKALSQTAEYAEKMHSEACQGKIVRSGLFSAFGQSAYINVCQEYFARTHTARVGYHSCLEEKACDQKPYRSREWLACNYRCGVQYDWNTGIDINTYRACHQTARAFDESFKANTETQKENSILCKARIEKMHYVPEMQFPGQPEKHPAVIAEYRLPNGSLLNMVFARDADVPVLLLEGKWGVYFPIIFNPSIRKADVIMAPYTLVRNGIVFYPQRQWSSGKISRTLPEMGFVDDRFKQWFTPAEGGKL